MTATAQMLEIPEVRARVSPVTVQQYHEFPEYNENGRRTELIRGIVIEKMSKSPLHCGIAKALYDHLLKTTPAGFCVRKDDPLTLTDSEPVPDIAIICGEPRDFADRHPSTAALVIEVAVTSAAEDRSLASLYAEAGVEEYWIILPAARRVEVHRQPEQGAYRNRSVIEGDAMLECAAVPNVRVNLAELFGR